MGGILFRLADGLIEPDGSQARPQEKVLVIMKKMPEAGVIQQVTLPPPIRREEHIAQQLRDMAAAAARQANHALALGRRHGVKKGELHHMPIANDPDRADAIMRGMHAREINPGFLWARSGHCSGAGLQGRPLGR